MANDSKSTQTADDMRGHLSSLLSEASPPMRAAIKLHAEIERMHSEHEDRCPAIEAHLRSLSFLLNSVDSRLDDIKVLTE